MAAIRHGITQLPADVAAQVKPSGYWKVNYIHGMASGSYRVSRSFTDRAGAEEFISVNAMVCRLPGVRLIDPEGNEVL